MLPIYHLIFAILFSLIFYKEGIIFVIILISSSVLVDIDHYFMYIFTTKNFNFIKAIKYFTEEKKGEGKFYLFHNIYFYIITTILVILFKNKYFLAFFLGISLHYIFDFYSEIKHTPKKWY